MKYEKTRGLTVKFYALILGIVLLFLTMESGIRLFLTTGIGIFFWIVYLLKGGR